MLKKLSIRKSLGHAKDLRSNQTDVEKILWSKLRNGRAGYKFRRQHPVGKYIADFICLEKALIIELDGSQHNEDVDRKRTEFLTAQGYCVLRFWNNDVLENLEGVYRVIQETLQGPGPHPGPLPSGEGNDSVHD